MAMKQFVYFFAGDENKGKKEQQLIRKQEEEKEQLEEEIHQARVLLLWVWIMDRCILQQLE